MRIAVHRNVEELFDSKWVLFLRERGHDVFDVDLKRSNIINEIKGYDGVMWHYLHNPDDRQSAPKILSTIEQVLHIPVWPNYATRWHFDEKVSQAYLLQSADIPHVPSYVFWNRNEAIEFVNNYDDYPIVFKLSVGAGAANVILLEDKGKAIQIINRMFTDGIYPYTMNGLGGRISLKRRCWNALRYCFEDVTPVREYYEIQKNYAYFQKYIRDNDRDLRITIIGDRAFGFHRLNREEDFRASGSGKIVYVKEDIPMDAVKIAFDLSERFGFQSMAYDFLIDKTGTPLVNEISYGYADWAVHDCEGYWDRKLTFHEGHIWPEQAHIDDFIDEIERHSDARS